MARLKNHPGFWLRDDAAAAFDAAEDKYGIFTVNSAGRTVAEQQEAINRWNQGGTYNRPPYLYQPANPPESSNHVAGGGKAVDIGDWRRFASIAGEFGFQHTYPDGDPVHFDFVGGVSSAVRDQVTADRQAFLNSRGWTLVVDGIEGPLTRQAYAEYQSQLNQIFPGSNLDVDGKWGPATQAVHQKFWDSLNNPSSRPSSKSAGELNYADIQAALNRHGYNLAVDNIWGPKSSNALADFQSRNGLKVDRLVGPNTWDKLNR